MRNLETDKYLIEYPNEIVFCFSPVIFRVQRIADFNLTFAKIMVRIGSNVGWSEVREVDKMGQIVFDVSRYMQMLLLSDREQSFIDYSEKLTHSPLARNLIVELHLYTTDSVDDTTISEVQKSWNFQTIWGCLDLGEEYGEQVARTWFVNFPFTVDLCCRTDNYFDVFADGKHLEQVFDIVNPGEYNKVRLYNYLVNIGRFFKPPQRELYIAVPACRQVKNDVEGEGVTSYKLTIDRSTSGIYLRWIDRQGRYCYYLFRSGSKSMKVKDEQTFIRDEMIRPNGYDVNKLHKGDGNRATKSIEDTTVLVAPLVDSEIFDFLTSLVTSPVVDMYKGEDDNGVFWQRINVTDGTISKSTKKLQDFTLTIQFPKRNQQQL